MGSVCDQANAAAINLLVSPNPNAGIIRNSGQLLTYKLGDTVVIHCYDGPHLLKGTRNNFLTKDLKHRIRRRWDSSMNVAENWINKKELVASWNDVSDVYSRVTKKLLPKITPEHIEPNKLKMKVSVATQVLSKTFGTVMLNCLEKGLVRRDCEGTAQVLMFFNDVFDSINGFTQTTNQLKSPVTKTSVHFNFWDYALRKLSEMKFINKTSGKSSNRTKNIQNWQSTIRGYAELSKKCLSLGMSEIALR